jgi:iron complex outermembrane recepter protein
LITNFQSNNNLVGTSISNAGNRGNLQWRAQMSHKIAGNYANRYDGKVYNSGFKELNGNLFLGVNKKWGYSHFNVSSFNSMLGIPEGERDSLGNFVVEKPDGLGGLATLLASKKDLNAYGIGFPRQEINHLRLTTNNYFMLKKGAIHLDLGIQNNKRKEFGDVLNPDDKALFFDLTTLNYNARFNFNEKNNWETAIGISGMQQSNQNRGLEVIIPNYHFFDAGIYGFAQKKWADRWVVAAGLRYDNRYISTENLWVDSLGGPLSINDKKGIQKFTAVKTNYNNVSASLGLTYQMGKKQTLKINFAQGFRAPNIAEITSNGRHEGTFRYELGNPNLKSEVSRQIDVAYFFNSDHISFEVTPFANVISDYIFSEKLNSVNGGDSIPDLVDPVPAFKFAQNGVKLLGGEVYFDIHPHPLDWLHLENAFSFVQATQNNASDSTRYLPFIPAAKYRGELKAHLKTWTKRLSNAYFKGAVEHYFSQNNVYSAFGTETTTPAYTLLSVGFGVDIQGFKRKDFIQLYFSGENLANIAYQNHLSRLKYAPDNAATGRTGIFNMGRNYSLKMLVNL